MGDFFSHPSNPSEAIIAHLLLFEFLVLFIQGRAFTVAGTRHLAKRKGVERPESGLNLANTHARQIFAAEKGMCQMRLTFTQRRLVD